MGFSTLLPKFGDIKAILDGEGNYAITPNSSNEISEIASKHGYGEGVNRDNPDLYVVVAENLAFQFTERTAHVESLGDKEIDEYSEVLEDGEIELMEYIETAYPMTGKNTNMVKTLAAAGAFSATGYITKKLLQK